MTEPIVSVVLPVYNCPAYVGMAIESVLSQSFADFELLIIDDGSTDETPEVIRQYVDPRLRVLSQANVGLAATLNRGIGLARGRYIARQDQDDWSLPDRLRRQVVFMDAHEDCALLGTWAEIWRERSKTDRAHSHPADGSELKYLLLLNNPFVHSSVMLRRAAMHEVGGYATDPARQPPEDYELWSRIARDWSVANLPEVLHVYREVEGSMSRIGPSPFLDHLVTICAENIAIAAGVPLESDAAVNLAALEHEAAHRMQGEPDFKVMTSVFREAARNVTGGHAARYMELASQHVEGMAERWREAQSVDGWRGILGRGRRRLRQLIR